MAMSVALEATYPTTDTWVMTLGAKRTVLETERTRTSWMVTAMTDNLLVVGRGVHGRGRGRGHHGGRCRGQGRGSGEGGRGREHGRGVVLGQGRGEGNEVAGKGVGRGRSCGHGRGHGQGRGRGDRLLHGDGNGDGLAGPVEQPLTLDDEDVAAPERQGVLPL